MAKNSAGSTMVLEWTPSGSTTATAFQASARDFSIERSMDAADATGYTNTNRQYVKTIGDFNPSLTIFLDDTTYTTEDLFTSGAAGTLDAYPWGKTAGKRKISAPVFVSSLTNNYPYDDVATVDIEFMPTGNATIGVQA
jgi:hypothetical protein